MARGNRFIFSRIIAALGVALPALWAGEARAATFTVNSNLDNGVNCTLRLAVAAAAGATNACQGTASAGNVVQLGGPGAAAVVLNPANGPIAVAASMTIQGNYQGMHPNFTDAVVSTSAGARIFQVQAGLTFNLAYVRLTGASVSGSDGAGLYISTGVTATLDTVQIDHCTGARGGGLFSQGSTSVTSSSFHDNFGTLGGAISDGGDSLTVQKSTFTNNRTTGSTGSGGAIYIAANQVNDFDRHVDLSTFSGNSAIYGGALWVGNRFQGFADTFDGNSANSTGGAIHALATTQLVNSTLVRNAASGGGAIFRDTRSFPGVYWVLRRNTIVFNSASGAGGGIEVIDAAADVANGVGSDNIIWGNRVSVAGGGADVYAIFNIPGLPCPDLIGGFNNHPNSPSTCITSDPLLGAYVSVNQRPKCYLLNAGSPAIDAGSPPFDNLPDAAEDQRGFFRALDGTRGGLGAYDMGAFEYDPNQVNLASAHNSFQSTTVLGAAAARVNDGNTDGNFWDGSVNHTDFGWNASPPPADYPGQYWFVDFGSLQNVGRVNIFNRTDCCMERLSHYNILAYNQTTQVWYVVSNHSGDDTTGQRLLSSSFSPVLTRYIMVAKTDQNYLHLAEVQVMGP